MIEYRIVKLKDKKNPYEIYDNASSQLLYKVKGKLFGLFFTKLRLYDVIKEDDIAFIKSNFLSRRKWKVKDNKKTLLSSISFKWLLGAKITLKENKNVYFGNDIHKEKISLENTAGKIAFQINYGLVKLEDTYICQTFDNVSDKTSILGSILIDKRKNKMN